MREDFSANIVAKCEGARFVSGDRLGLDIGGRPAEEVINGWIVEMTEKGMETK